MAASFTKVASLVVAGLNAASTYTATPSDPRFYTQQIKDAILIADGAVVDIICENPTSSRRRDYLTSSVVAHLGQVPSHIGPIEAVTVDGAGAVPWDKSEIERERANILGLTFIQPHYFLDNNILYHNGITATVTYCTYVASVADPPVLQSPDEYSEAVACKALSFLLNIEGENTAAAEFYDNHWRTAQSTIRGAHPLPQFELYGPQQQEEV